MAVDPVAKRLIPVEGFVGYFGSLVVQPLSAGENTIGIIFPFRTKTRNANFHVFVIPKRKKRPVGFRQPMAAKKVCTLGNLSGDRHHSKSSHSVGTGRSTPGKQYGGARRRRNGALPRVEAGFAREGVEGFQHEEAI
jgi:hypothetical protein